MKSYEVVVAVSGYYTFEVEANSADEAEAIAGDYACNIDCGRIEDFDWQTVSVIEIE